MLQAQCRRHPALPDQLDRLDLELSTKLSSPHDHLRLHETPKLGVHQTGSGSVLPIAYGRQSPARGKHVGTAMR